MKSLFIALILFCLLFSPCIFAQSTGIVEGRLVNRTNPAIIPGGVELEALELDGGMNIVKTAVTAGDGTFRFEGLAVSRPLMIRVTYKGVNFHVRPDFDSTGKAQVELVVYEPGASRDDIHVESNTIVFQMEGVVLRSLETVALNNKSNPPAVFIHPEGVFRTSKPDGILEPPVLRILAPDATMPVTQPVMESNDGMSYYSPYPLKPGITSFEIRQAVPYTGEGYTHAGRFYMAADSVEIGVIPYDMELHGEGLTKIESNPQENFSVYRSPPIEAGKEFVWTFSGGTPVTRAAEPAATAQRSTIKPLPGTIGRNAMVILPLLLMGFVLFLWHASNVLRKNSEESDRYRIRKLEEHRDRLLDLIARADHRHETGTVGPDEYRQQREELKGRLCRLYRLLQSG
ncbi:MAG TPA: carboxypeptidase-like regulatory domain-containing protein [Acidobacteriota bacterium]|nr:carboxypeptidase-like regulatory domain-containing protein [Acidobacteriota bacterium]